MKKCKYPNEICPNMTLYNGFIYCGSVPCSLKDEIPKQTNGDRIRSMTNEELAEWMHNLTQFHDDENEPYLSIYDIDKSEEIELHDSYGDILYFLNKERDTD